MISYPSNKFDPKWVQLGITPEVNEWAKSFGEFLCDLGPDPKNPGQMKVGNRALTTSQLRKFFGEVKRIETDFCKYKADVIMLEPALAYSIGRDKNDKGLSKTRIKELGEQLTIGLHAIRYNTDKAKSDFSNFVKVFEAIVAYHKFYGGK